MLLVVPYGHQVAIETQCMQGRWQHWMAHKIEKLVIVFSLASITLVNAVYNTLHCSLMFCQPHAHPHSQCMALATPTPTHLQHQHMQHQHQHHPHSLSCTCLLFPSTVTCANTTNRCDVLLTVCQNGAIHITQHIKSMCVLCV